MPKALTDQEETYVDVAIQSGIQSTEVLNVLVMGRIQKHILDQLYELTQSPIVNIKQLTPTDIQTLYTECKVGIQQVFRDGTSVITGDYIPRQHRPKQNDKEG